MGIEVVQFKEGIGVKTYSFATVIGKLRTGRQGLESANTAYMLLSWEPTQSQHREL